MTEHTMEIFECAEEYGTDFAASKYGISRETVRRKCREVKSYLKENESKTKEKEVKDIVTREKYAEIIADKYSLAELKAISQGFNPNTSPIEPIHDFVSGDWVKIGVLSDTHLGSKYTNPNFIYDAFEIFDQEDVDMIAHSGDVHEGMSNRAGHVYELSHIGYTAQKNHSVGVFKHWTKTPMYFIDGNHDRWFVKNSGAYIVEEMCKDIPNAIYLGQDEGTIWLNAEKTVDCRLWHGEDGNSYATSYRLQKLVESFAGGSKPNVLIAGHVHKQGNFMIRNVHCFSAGCIQAQTPWMRSKRLAAHPGFWILNLKVGDYGISRIQSEWFPFYQ